jgi:hypothetical protein
MVSVYVIQSLMGELLLLHLRACRPDLSIALPLTAPSVHALIGITYGIRR